MGGEVIILSVTCSGLSVQAACGNVSLKAAVVWKAMSPGRPAASRVTQPAGRAGAVTVSKSSRTRGPHWSSTVHRSPSSHGSLLLSCRQPVSGSQPSVVQTLPSSHEAGGPPAHRPDPLQVSSVEQALASSQAKPAGSWLSWQEPDRQMSGLSQAESPGSPQAFPLAAGPSLTQPSTGSHESMVQTLPSSHEAGGPPAHTPEPLHASAVVQALASSQAKPAGS